MSRILVTGATTPVGRALVERLLQDPSVEHILAVGREFDGYTHLPHAPRVAYLRVDLTRFRSIRDLLFGPAQAMRIDTIVHTALHRNARDEGAKVHRLNVDATRELLRLCESHPTIRRFVFQSHGGVYLVRADQPTVVMEDHPLNLEARAPQWVRDRIEADLTVCTRMGLSKMEIAVLRTAEVLAPESGSQLYDYLSSAVCFRPMGYDPMINLLSLEDAADALFRAAKSRAQGVFNIPGADSLPLSELIRTAGRIEIPMVGWALTPAYVLRAWTEHRDFRYDLNRGRFHFSGILDGHRADEVLSYRPRCPIDLERLMAKAHSPVDPNELVVGNISYRYSASIISLNARRRAQTSRRSSKKDA